MSKVIGILGPAGQIFAFTLEALSKTNKEDKIFQEFAKLHERFDEIEKKLENLGNKIEEESTFTTYENEVVKPKRALFDFSARYQNLPEASTLRDFQNACTAPRKTPLDMVTNLKYYTEDKLGGNLFDSFYTASNFDRRRMHEYIFRVMGDIVEVGVLAELCAHVDPTKPSKQVTDDYAKKVQEVAEKIQKQFKRLDEKLLKEWHNKAQEEFKEKVKNYHNKNDPNTRPHAVHDELAKKYYWVGFFVSVFGYHHENFAQSRGTWDAGKTYDGNTATGGYIVYDNEGVDKSALLAWRDKSNKGLGNDWRDKADKAINSWKDDSSSNCDRDANDILTRSSFELGTGLTQYQNFKDLNPSWIYVIYNPSGRHENSRNTHGQVYSKGHCWGRLVSDMPHEGNLQQIIIGWN